MTTLPFAVFDEFGKPADDRVQDAIESARQQGMSQAKALWEMAKAEQAVPVAWERIAWLLAEQDGEDPSTLICEGFPPEPWGEAWLRYEKPARQIADLFAARPPATERRPLTVPMTREQVKGAMWAADWPPSMLSPAIFSKLEQFAHAVEQFHGITAGTTEQAKEQGNE